MGLIDFDLDGDVDAFVCNGHLLENAKEIEPNTSYGVANAVLENQNDKLFRTVTKEVGDAYRSQRVLAVPHSTIWTMMETSTRSF